MILNPMNPVLQAKVGLDYTDDICRDPRPSKVKFPASGGLRLNYVWGAGGGAQFNLQQRPSETVSEQANGGRRNVRGCEGANLLGARFSFSKAQPWDVRRKKNSNAGDGTIQQDNICKRAPRARLPGPLGDAAPGGIWRRLPVPPLGGISIPGDTEVSEVAVARPPRRGREWEGGGRGSALLLGREGS